MVRHGGRMGEKGVHGSERYGPGAHLKPVHEINSRLHASLEFKTKHATGLLHLFFGKFMIGMRG